MTHGRQIVGSVSLVLCCMQAMAYDGWTPTEKGMLVTAEALIAKDMLQTIEISNSCHSDKKFKETNSILGECPTHNQVVGYFLVSGVVTYLIADFLPATPRKLYLSGVIVLQYKVTQHNQELGIHIKF